MTAWEVHQPTLSLWETKPIAGVRPKRVLAAQIYAIDNVNYGNMVRLSLRLPSINLQRDFIVVGKGFLREFLPHIGGYFLTTEDGLQRGYLGSDLFERYYHQVTFDGVDIDAAHKAKA